MIFEVGALPEDFLLALGHIDELRRQLKYATSDSRRRWTGLLRRSTFARAIQGSNTIEGYNVTQEDAVNAVDEEEPFDATTEAWMAVSGYRTAMSYVLQLADDPHYLHNEGTINSLQYMMVSFDLKANPGRWRRGAIWVRNEQSGETVYDGPDVATVPALMRELVASLNASNGLPVMVRAAMAHLNLVMIHPYSDGNGRMGRALQSMVLAREGILEPTFSSIEEYLGRNTPAYYAVLAEVGQGSWHPQNSPLPWIKFCLTAHYRQAHTLLRRTTEMEALWSALENELRKLRLNERTIFAAADAAFGMRVRNSGYRKHTQVSEEVAGRDLRLLVENGLLEPQGEKRGRCYVASERLRAFRKQAMSQRPPKTLEDPFDMRSGQISLALEET